MPLTTLGSHSTVTSHRSHVHKSRLGPPSLVTCVTKLSVKQSPTNHLSDEEGYGSRAARVKYSKVVDIDNVRSACKLQLAAIASSHVSVQMMFDDSDK